MQDIVYVYVYDIVYVYDNDNVYVYGNDCASVYVYTIWKIEINNSIYTSIHKIEIDIPT